MKKQIENKTNESINEKLLRVADVARELNIDPKRARAFLRKNVALYVARKQSFAKTSKLYTQTRDALMTYKKSLTSIAS